MAIASQVVPVNIEDEVKESYLSYSMSVIIGRALPDVRDGLKPVHRRILYGMYEMGNEWNKAYKKSARIVGDVMGKYHPHGDAAIYDALVRMAQDFSMRYEIVDGQGNFGSVDGDPPAAMRYTEVRLARIASEILEDIDKETVEFVPNYDDSTIEPSVLPARIPNLLLNGSSGIAVGMSTNIPPHNLGELIGAVIAQIKNPNISLEGLMEHVPGPDFPTGGFILGRGAIRDAYATGRGIVKMRARAKIEKQKKGERDNIVVTEIPFQVNKAKLIERIADLVKDEKIKGISDIRDESDRDGIRVVIELKRGENAEVVLNQLYKHTPMDSSFGIIMLALVRNQPRILSLKDLIVQFIEHRKEVVTKRIEFELRKAEARLHILEGLKIALDHLDAVISLIRGSASPQEARQGLVLNFSLSDIQAQAILDMRLQRLTALERGKITEERSELIKTIRHLSEILDKEALLFGIIIGELEDIRSRYSDERRTEIIESAEEISIEDLIADEDVVVTITHDGYIKNTPLSIYRSQRRGGKGRMGMITKDSDFIESIFVASTHRYVLFFTNLGRCYWLKVHEIPEAGPSAKGKAIVNLLDLSSRDENIAAVLPVTEFKEDRFIVMATKKGIVKKTDLMAYSNRRVGGIIAIGIREGDELISARITGGSNEILLTTRYGQAVRFAEEEVRDTGRGSMGVIGIRLDEGDEVVGLDAIENQNALILTVTDLGYGKRTQVSEYRLIGRGGRGVITMKTTEKNGLVVASFLVTDDMQLILITNKGKMIRIEASNINIYSRGTQGVKLIDLEPGEKVAAVARIVVRENRVS